jgi:hypothetical protein
MIATQIKANVPVDSTALQKSISSVIRSYKGGKIKLGIIGTNIDYTGYTAKNKKEKRVFKKGKKENGKAGFRQPFRYSHLVEKGTQQRKTMSGANRGAVSATNYMEKTRQQVEQQVAAIFEKAVAAAVG